MSGVTPRDRSPICVLDGCVKSAHKRHPMCSMHRARMSRHGDPSVTVAPSERRTKNGSDNPRWNAAGSYTAVHQRLRKFRGPARERSCVDCGRPAQHWSLDDRSTDCIDSDYGPFSTDLSRYVPRCVPCHKAHDLMALMA